MIITLKNGETRKHYNYYQLWLGSGYRLAKGYTRNEAVDSILGKGNWHWGEGRHAGYAVRPGSPGHTTYYEVKMISESTYENLKSR